VVGRAKTVPGCWIIPGCLERCISGGPPVVAHVVEVERLCGATLVRGLVPKCVNTFSFKSLNLCAAVSLNLSTKAH
jgi:hypothetical protein